VLELDLGYNRISDSGCVALHKLVEMTKSILAMDLRMNDFGVPGAKLLADGLLQNSSLQTLVLKGCKIGDRGGLALAEVLQTNTTLESLDVGDCDLEVPSLIAFRTVLQYNSTLRELVLDRPLIKSAHEEVATHMAALLQNNRGLQRLSLRKHGINDFGARRLAEALANNEWLLTLDIASNNVSRDGATALAEMIMVNDTLQDLNLDGNEVQDEGILSLSAAIVEAPVKSLRSLGVARGGILGAISHRTGNVEQSGLVAFARALKAVPELTTFRVWGNPAISGIGQLDSKACTELGLILTDRVRETYCDIKPYTIDGQILLAEVQVDSQGRPL